MFRSYPWDPLFVRSSFAELIYDGVNWRVRGSRELQFLLHFQKLIPSALEKRFRLAKGSGTL